MSHAFASRGGKALLVAGWLFSCGGAGTTAPAVKPARTEARKCDGVLPPLPDPVEWKVPWPELTPEQRRKKDEVDQYEARAVCEASWRIVTITQDDSGNFIDWVDPYTMEGYFVDPPDGPGNYVSPEIRRERERRKQNPGLHPMIRRRWIGYILEDTTHTSFEEWITEHDKISRVPVVKVPPSRQGCR
jgi:hypothetical protein